MTIYYEQYNVLSPIIVMQNLSHLGVKKWGEYIAKDCIHLKIMSLYHQWASKSILEEVQCPIGEANWKVIQMKTLFHILARGCPMLEYKSLYELFVNL